MKTVRLENGIVAEIIPEYALPVEKWYGEVFASECAEASDTVKQGFVYDAETGLFSEPVAEPEPPTPEERITLLEQSKADQTEVDAIAAAIEKGLSL